MKSSSGAHYLALDHVRALAAFLVFTWHFLHGGNGSPVRFDELPLIPFAMLDEGHTGIALFMTLSGYLFAKLLEGKRIDYGAFLWNRVLRLLPLLLVVIAIVGIGKWLARRDMAGYLADLRDGLLLPTLPNGGWSIAVEFHFYIILPALLWMLGRSKWLAVALLAAAIGLRTLLFSLEGEVQQLAYWTLAGRIDQFVMGMLFCHLRSRLAHRHGVIAVVVAAFMSFYWYFDLRGGFYHFPSYPSASPLWIIIPTVEALAYASLIAWYDSSFSPPDRGVSRFVGRIGEYSYSIYLLHFFVVFHAAELVDQYVMDISNFYLACGWSLVVFMLMMVPGYLSYRFIESPFLRLRKRYARPA